MDCLGLSSPGAASHKKQMAFGCKMQCSAVHRAEVEDLGLKVLGTRFRFLSSLLLPVLSGLKPIAQSPQPHKALKP